ncbi:MAG: carbohydrate ABC transporter permease [Candidatus Omnitrophica bacterium]|nr:carbohydrate ABC transporter permease [Candidatus Omnitrophota bacterium]
MARAHRQKKERVKKIIRYALISLGALVMLYPFIWMINTSLSPLRDLWQEKEHWWQYWAPSGFEIGNYVNVWTQRVLPFGRAYLNSIFVSVLTTVGVLLTSSLAGYSFARLHFKGRDKIFFVYLATMMIPGAVTMIPVYILLRTMGWVDTYKAVIIPGIFTAYGTFMLRQFFMTLPADLEDAAKIDGCSLLGIYWRIILPLSKPALATLGTFTFMGAWMNFMWPLIVLNSQEKYTLPVLLSYFQSQYHTNYTMLMAASAMYVLPIIVVFLFCQRFFVEGIKLSGIKG